jgi:adenylate cyclase
LSSEDHGAGAVRRLVRLGARLARPGLFQALALAAVLLFLPALYPPFFTGMRLKGFDLEERLMPRRQQNLPVVIVAIDEASLAQPFGQWPWPRTLVAQLVSKIAEGRPAALGVDIIFSEPDRFSPENLAAALQPAAPALAKELEALPSSETALAAAFESAPTVLGMAVPDETVAGPQARFRPPPIRTFGADPRPFLQAFPALLHSLPVITAGAAAEAALVGNPDLDGIVRRVPLFIVVDGTVVPSLAAATLRVATGSRPMAILASPDGIAGARIGDYSVPTDRNGRVYPYFGKPQSSVLWSAADVLNGAVDLHALAGKIVLLGVTGAGLVDIKQTPLGLMQGIEVHAQLLQSILSDELLSRPIAMRRIEIAFAIVAAVIVVFGFPYSRPRLAAGFLGAMIVACLGVEIGAFKLGHLLFDGTYPAIVSIGAFGAMLAANLRAIQQELERERDAKARLEGELNAARAIQMGLLPRPLPRLAETRAVEVHALIETARMVGGDLYDFVMLDSRLLFFAIADVSGKGVDAAIFMAMTKMVLGGATLQHGEALDRVFDEANAKISAASDHTRAEGGRPMFVTVFAAVLELDTGIIAFASAGHDAPYLLRAGGAPLRLETEGGPPLGTLDEFPFPVDTARLEPGDTLLLYTDGVTEAKDNAGAFYGSARLDGLLSQPTRNSARWAVELVREDVRRFVGDAEQADDITLLGVRWLGPDAA